MWRRTSPLRRCKCASSLGAILPQTGPKCGTVTGSRMPVAAGLGAFARPHELARQARRLIVSGRPWTQNWPTNTPLIHAGTCKWSGFLPSLDLNDTIINLEARASSR